jgi:hypothetical protein
MNSKLNYYVVPDGRGTKSPELRLRLARGYSHLSPSDFLLCECCLHLFGRLPDRRDMRSPELRLRLARGYSHLTPSVLHSKLRTYKVDSKLEVPKKCKTPCLSERRKALNMNNPLQAKRSSGSTTMTTLSINSEGVELLRSSGEIRRPAPSCASLARGYSHVSPSDFLLCECCLHLFGRLPDRRDTKSPELRLRLARGYSHLTPSVLHSKLRTCSYDFFE